MKKFNLVKGLVISLMAFALAFTAFGAVSASAEEAAQAVVKPTAVSARFDNVNNKITATANAVVYVLKQEKANEIKKGAKTAGSLTKDAATPLEDLKIKGTTKDVFLYICDKEFEAADKVDANFVIKAQAAKKVVGKIDYTKADTTTATNVLSIVATDKDKKAIAIAECVWAEELAGPYKASTEFTGAKLASMLADGGQIFVKMVGANDPAQFASKVIKVKIAKQGKAPKVKYDQKKDSIALKNGFDIGLATKVDDADAAPESWFTILPNFKSATKKTAEESIVATISFTPCDKKDEAYKNNTTQYKFKALSVNDIAKKLNNEYAGGEFTLAVRKSATVKAPASAITYIKFDAVTKAPIVFTEDKVAGQFDIATVTDFDKKGFTIGTVANYNGENGTEGFWNTFKLKETAGTGADKNAAAYEYLVVKKADLDGNKIDWTTASWSKLDPAKTKINGKLKAKYSDVNGKKADTTLKALAKPDGFNPSTVPAVESLLLVRRAGVKGDAPVRPSAYVELYVIKDNKSYILYSKVAVGTEADAYAVDFYTLQKKDGVYAWAKDESIDSITGWTDEDTAKVEFPAIDGAKFYKYTTAVGDELTATEKKYTVDKGSNKVAVAKATKVTVDYNGGKLTADATKTSVVLDTDKEGKITLPNIATTVTAPTGKVFDKFYTNDKGTDGAEVNANLVYGENTTIYVLWKDAPAGD